MDPFFARNRLSAYLDGALSQQEAAEVEAAIDQDPALQAEFDAMRRTVELLRQQGPAEAPTGFHARVMAQVADEPAPGKVTSLFHRVFARVPVEAVALAAAAVVVVLVIQQRGQDELTDSAAALREQASSYEGSSGSLAKDEAPAPEADAQAAQQPAEPIEQAQAEPARAAKAAPNADGDLLTGRGAGVDADLPTQAAPMTKGALEKGVMDKKAGPAMRGAKVPDEPYYAGWEQEAPGGLDASDVAANTGDDIGTPEELYQGIDMARPFAYRISLADAQILFQLSAVAEQSGGRLTDASGRTLSPTALSADGGYTRVHVVVPRDASAAVHDRLRALQATATPPPSTTVLYGSDHAVFVIDVSAAN